MRGVSFDDAMKVVVDHVVKGYASLADVAGRIVSALSDSGSLSVDASEATLAGFLRAMPNGMIVQPGVLADAINGLNPDVHAGAQGIARRITASRLIDLTLATRCVSHLKTNWPKGDGFSVRASTRLVSVTRSRDVGIADAFDEAGVEYEYDHARGVLVIDRRNVMSEKEATDLLKRITGWGK